METSTSSNSLVQVANFIYDAKPIGRGEFSEVFLGYEIFSKQKVAVKQIDARALKDDVHLLMMNNEIEILQLMANKKNVLKLLSVYSAPPFVYIVTEYCNGGDLGQLVQRSKLTEDKAIDILEALLHGLLELRAEGVVHRDIKSANILLQNNIPKIADFGFAICNQIPQHFDLDSYNVGTPVYMSPESLIQNQYSFKSDVWSAGVIFFEMIFGRVPFKTHSETELLSMLVQFCKTGLLVYPSPIAPQTDQLLRNMLQPDVKQRWSVDQCLHYVKTLKTQRYSSPPQRASLYSQQKVVQSTYSSQRNLFGSPPHNQFATQSISNSPTHNQFKAVKNDHPEQPQELLTERYFKAQSFQPRQPISIDIGKSQRSFPEKKENKTVSTVSTAENSPMVNTVNQSDTHHLVAQIILKIQKLFVGVEPFECYFQQKLLTKTDVYILFRKLEFLMGFYCTQILTPGSLLAETKAKVSVLRLSVMQQKESYFCDNRFLQVLSGLYRKDQTLSVLLEYNTLCVQIINEMFRHSDCANPRLIVLLDYLVTQYMMLKLFQKSGAGDQPDEAHLKAILASQPSFFCGRTHWEQVDRKIQFNF